jgi:hypothetical protein
MERSMFSAAELNAVNARNNERTIRIATRFILFLLLLGL